MVVFRFLLIFMGFRLVVSGIVYDVFGPAVSFKRAVSTCNYHEQRLAVLDTPETLAALLEQRVPLNRSPWIGLKRTNSDDFVWLNGNVLSPDQPNWSNSPVHQSGDCGYITTSGRWALDRCDNTAEFICERYACDPAFFETGYPHRCVKCTGNTIRTNVGNATDCNRDGPCDGVTTVPNHEHTACICNAGYYKSGSSCEQCTGNKIKTMVGDATSCDADEPCDGVGEVPNANHTACVTNDDSFVAVNGIRSASYILKQLNVEITSAEVISLKVDSKLECGMECLKRGCKEFLFQRHTPDGIKCKMIMSGNVTDQPVEGAKFYTKT